MAPFTGWYRAMRAAATGADTAADGAAGTTAEGAVGPTADTAAGEERYRQAATLLNGSGMPGVESGLLPLATFCLRVWRRKPADFPDDTA